jgi:hypothetical protein
LTQQKRRSGRALRRAAALTALALSVLTTSCGESPTPPFAVVQNYLNDIGAGNYAAACGLLDKSAREAPLKAAKPRVTCAKVFVRCLPDNVIRLTHDQTQLLYASIQLNVTGKTATASVGGTVVARAIRNVTLAEQQGTWRLTSYGQAVRHCNLNKARHRRNH